MATKWTDQIIVENALSFLGKRHFMYLCKHLREYIHHLILSKIESKATKKEAEEWEKKDRLEITLYWDGNESLTQWLVKLNHEIAVFAGMINLRREKVYIDKPAVRMSKDSVIIKLKATRR